MVQSGVTVGQKFWVKSYKEIVPYEVTDIISDTEFSGIIWHDKYQILNVKHNINDINKTIFENKTDVQ